MRECGIIADERNIQHTCRAQIVERILGWRRWMMNELTQKYVRSLFDYRDGKLYWAVVKAQCIKVGDHAGSVNNSGYLATGINDKRYLTHRLIFLYHHGYLPKFLDHIDGDPTNNDISNLREATMRENQQNQKKTKSYGDKSTSSKFKCVSWHKRTKKWAAYITVGGKRKHLGLFTSEIEAAHTYDKAAIEAFGEFAKLNSIN